MKVKIWQGFKHMWSLTPHRIGGLANVIGPGGRAGRARHKIGNFPNDRGRVFTSWRNVKGATRTRVVVPVSFQDAYDEATGLWNGRLEHVLEELDLPEGEQFVAVLGGLEWSSESDEGGSSVFMTHLDIDVALNGSGGLTANVAVQHADGPDPFMNAPSGVYTHEAILHVDILGLDEQAEIEFLDKVVHERGGIKQRNSPRAIPRAGTEAAFSGIRGFHYSFLEGGPFPAKPGRVLDYLAFSVEEYPNRARVQAAVQGNRTALGVGVYAKEFRSGIRLARVRSQAIEAGKPFVAGTVLRARTSYEQRFKLRASLRPDISIVEVPTGMVGAGRSEIKKLPVGGPTAGFSALAPHAKEALTPLYARALMLERASDDRVFFVALEVHSGTLAITRRLQQLLKEHDIGAQATIVTGTHTHHGPAGIYGNKLYDAMAGPLGSGAQPEVIESIARAAFRACKQAFEQRLGGSIEYVEDRVWGLHRNRSVRAFPWSDETWSQPGWPGADAPEDLHRMNRLVDPRLRALVARDGDGALVGAFATFSCHNTALGVDIEAYGHDWFGVAALEAESELGGSDRDVVIGIAPSAAGDATPLPVGKFVQGRKHTKKRGRQLGKHLIDLLSVPGEAQPVDYEVRHDSWRPDQDSLNGELWLGNPRFGDPTLGGAEDGRSPFFQKLGFREGVRRTGKAPHGDVQHPKKIGVSILQPIVFWLAKLRPSPIHPLVALKVAGRTILTVPGEPTASTVHQLEQAVRDQRDELAWVVGYAQDYAGYFTTRDEYRSQHYEGSSTLYGRNQVDHLETLYIALLGADPGDPAERDDWTPDESPAPPVPQLAREGVVSIRDGRRIHVAGGLPDATNPPVVRIGGTAVHGVVQDTEFGRVWVAEVPTPMTEAFDPVASVEFDDGFAVEAPIE